MLQAMELGADPSTLDGIAARGRGPASLVLLAAPLPEGFSPTLRIIVHDTVLEAAALVAADQGPGAPAPIVPPLPARDARRIRDLLRTRGITAEVVRADAWRRAILVAGSSFDEVAEAIARAEAFAARAAIPPAERPSFVAVVREAAANAAHHGNADDPARRVRIDIIVREGALTLTVEDEGPGFDYQAAARDLDGAKDTIERATERLAAGGRGGLGLLMIRRWADRVRWDAGGRRIRIEKRLAGA